MQVLALSLVAVIIVLRISSATEIVVGDPKGNVIIDSGQQKDDERDGADLNSLLNKLANKIQSWLENHDPYEVPHTKINVTNKMIRVDGFVDQSSVADASSTNINIRSMEENNTYYVNCNLTIESLNVVGGYDLDLHAIEQVYISGKGDYKISLADMKIMAAMKVTETNNMQLKVNKFHFKYNIDKILVEISGLFGGGAVGDLVENVLNDLIRKILTDYNGFVSKIVRKFGESLLICHIDGLTMANVTEIIERIINDESYVLLE